ncbi:hypothetical protein L6164_029321 [Bauhinia variegata]|uniref:Uncharacterized protein n=1 Tax=Bauhinia variegata TaxID=167791 RepID=A0ACB9L8R2_BAUVA|nr:hypothetical protein L6164_029321 [Bauhinia variegata]
MGKKVSQATTLKISKNSNERHQFNSLIKVLKPKVYITDSSNFKNLVQELTGNGSSTTLSPPPLEPKVVENSLLISTQQDQTSPESGFEALVDQRDLEISFEASVSTETTTTTTTTTNSEELCYSAVISEEFDAIYKHMCLDDIGAVLEDQLLGADDLFAYQNLESVVFDVEPDQFYSCYEQIQQEDVSIYDYELSGLI